MQNDTKDETLTPAPERAAALSRAHFNAGYYCAESVLLAIAGTHGTETAGLARLMSGMCGGVARTGGMCGALLGGVAAIGLLFGRDEPGDDKTPSYTLTQQLVNTFRAEFGATTCHGVLPCDISTAEGVALFQQQQLAETRCLQVTERAAAMVQELVDKREEPAPLR
jgi:C_GCAxxG_C_C family probable redox protein